MFYLLLYQPKNSSEVFMMSFAHLKIISYIFRKMGCDQESGFKDSKGEVWANTIKDWEVDLQHGTGEEENSHKCIKGYHPQVRDFAFENPNLNIIQHCINTVYF